MTEKVESEAEVRDIALAGELLPFRNVKELHENQEVRTFLLRRWNSSQSIFSFSLQHFWLAVHWMN